LKGDTADGVIHRCAASSIYAIRGLEHDPEKVGNGLYEKIMRKTKRDEIMIGFNPIEP
jgi:hypothetical protein